MALKVPADAKFGFLIALGVLSALAVWSFIAPRVGKLA